MDINIESDLGSKTTLRVMVVLRGQLQANHSLPNGGGQVGADANNIGDAGYLSVKYAVVLSYFESLSH